MSKEKSHLWNKVKLSIKKDVKRMGATTPIIALYEIGSSISAIFEISKEEIINSYSERSDPSRIKHLTKIFRSLAIIEEYYKLSQCRHTYYLTDPLDSEYLDTENLLDTYSSSMSIMSDLAVSITEVDSTKLQYAYNRLFEISLAICEIYDINKNKCFLVEEVIKETDKKATKTNKVKKSVYLESYRELKKQTKIKGAIEIEVIGVIDKRSNPPFKGINIKGPEGLVKFKEGELITDYFSASCYIASKYKDKKYVINYCPKMREMLNASVSTICISYIHDGKIITMEEASNLNNHVVYDDNTISIDRDALPVIVPIKMSSVDDFFDYINDVKSGKI